MGRHLRMEPHVSLSPLSKYKGQVETHAKNIVNNPRGMLHTHLHALEGGTNFQCVVSHGGQPYMGRHVCM